MADFSNYAVTAKPPATLNVDVYTLEATLTESDTGAVIADFTGPAALQWPTCFNALPDETKAEIFNDLAPQLLRLAAGLPR